MLVRARDPHEAEVRLWQALQLHMDFPRFYEYLADAYADFSRRSDRRRNSACPTDDYDRLIHTTDSVIHCAASLNRKSEKSCLNVNLRGTLEVVQLAQQVALLSRAAPLQPREHGGGCGQAPGRSRHRRRVDRLEPLGLRSLCAHQEILRAHDPAASAGSPKTIFRPSIVLGDSRHAETTQFDMVKAFVFLAGLPVLPFRPKDKIDIVNVDFVADAIATLASEREPQYDTYHLSSGAIRRLSVN